MVWLSISSFTRTKKASKKGSFILGSKDDLSLNLLWVLSSSEHWPFWEF